MPKQKCRELMVSSPQTLTEPEKKIRKRCYQIIGAAGPFSAGV